MNNQYLEQVITQVKAWAVNRRLYPGWVVAPYSSRDKLLVKTRNWLRPILESLPLMSPEQKLVVLDEMNWRLETALIPLPPEVVDSVTSCLKEINPFPSVLEQPTATLTLMCGNEDAVWHPLGESCEPRLNWAGIAKTWVRLALGCLRFHREERQHERFDHWSSTIGKIVSGYPEEQLRLWYERCLAALARMDGDAVCAALDTWPDNGPEDLVWAIRRAAILADIGRCGEAEALVESALNSLRAQAVAGQDDIPSFSREGWAMLLLSTLKNRAFSMQAGARPDYRGRWEELRGCLCNPRVELEILETKLEQAAPRAAPQSEVRPTFHPGGFTRSYQMGEHSSEKLLPAYQFMRLTEEAPFPPRCDNWLLSENNLRRVAAWFMVNDPVRTVTLMLRLASTEIVEPFLTRQRVAALPMSTIEELYTTCLRVVETGLGAERTRPEVIETAIGERAARQIQASIEILSRVAVRLPADRLDQLLTLAIKLYQSAAVRSSVSLPRRLKNLFTNLIVAMGNEGLTRRFLDLLVLPVPGSQAFAVAFVQGWPEPVWKLGGRNLQVVRPRRSEPWKQAISQLLLAANSERWEVRLHALASLLRLEGWGRLTSAELRQLVRILWARVNEGTGLPEMPGVQNFALLSLPEPRNGKVLELFRNYLNENDLLRFCQESVGPDGVRQRMFTMHPMPEVYIRDWLGATATPGATNAMPRRQFIDWTQSNAALLFQKIKTWWTEEGHGLADTATGHIGEGLFRERMNHILDALEWIVIPRAAVGSRLATDIVNLIDDFDAQKVPMEKILPAVMRLKPNAEFDTASRLRRSLAAVDEEKQQAALYGLTSWLRNQAGSGAATKGYELPRVPEDLLQELGSRVANRRQPGLRLVLQTTVVVLRNLPERVNRKLVQALTIGLEYLLTETEYRLDEEMVSQIPAAEIPSYRMLGAQIAALLAQLRRRRSEVVDKWLEAARQDPLPEIRRAIDTSSAESDEG